ncbi:hypothetical protein [Streptomyces sp. NPDC093509]|uniref:hypothetical protein n=1 Tax=unclassified Streptomyces TaxID=2593676 RepID=UPI00344CB8F1
MSTSHAAPGDWTPRWATGSDFSKSLRDTMSGHAHSVAAVACTNVDRTAIAVTGGADNTVLV